MAIENKEIEKAGSVILRAQDIVQELMITLNTDYEISDNLYALYDYMYRRLIDANISKDIAPLDETLDLMTDLRDTWTQVIKINRKEIYGDRG